MVAGHCEFILKTHENNLCRISQKQGRCIKYVKHIHNSEKQKRSNCDTYWDEKSTFH